MESGTHSRRSKIGKFVFVSGSILFGLLLVALLFLLPGFELDLILHDLAAIDPFYMILLVAVNIFHFYITGVKWRLVSEAISPGTKFGNGFFIYTSLNGLIGQVLPLQFSTVAVRSLAMRIHIRIPLVKGALSTIYDQMFDLTVTLLALISAITVITGILDPFQAFALLFLELLVAGVIISFLNRHIVAFVTRFGSRVPLLSKALRSASSGDQNSESTQNSLFSPALTAKLFALSALRYCNLILRNFLIVPAAALSISFFPVAMSLPFVLLASVIAITPASLGISEWTWVGLFTFFNISAMEAARYSVLRRLLLIFAIILINVGIFVLLSVVHAVRLRKDPTPLHPDGGKK